ncbi:hypothetical protein TWF481_007092 [Arthrobotrys musiformis]|uniref:HNH nuclease domain-containing protein n=1 Tax=Arthrobotrys musiformis TaxID=47236 RepID=A0AAV9WC26_9PEZI
MEHGASQPGTPAVEILRPEFPSNDSHEHHVFNTNPPLSLADVFRHITAKAAGIDIDHSDPDTLPNGWLNAPTDIFKTTDVHIDNNRYIEPFEYSGHRISVLHLVYALLTYGLQPNILALELLKKLLKIQKVRELLRLHFRMRGKPMNDQDLQLQLKVVHNWDDVVEGLFGVVAFGQEMRRWARRYFAGLLVPMVAAKGTPSSNGTATSNRTQAALRELCLKRDGHMTVIGRVWNRFWPKDVVPPPRTELWDYGALKACHIIPHGSPDSPNLRELLINFSGDSFIIDMINHTSNALMLTTQFHSSFRRFEWSIEARLIDEERNDSDNWVYVFRKFNPYLPRALDHHADGEEVIFGSKDGKIPSPNPELLNVYTALAKVANASGAAEAIDLILRDEEEMRERGQTGNTWGKVGQNYLVRQLERLSTE